MTALPTAANTVMFAEMYDIRPDAAAKTVGMTAVLLSTISDHFTHLRLMLLFPSHMFAPLNRQKHADTGQMNECPFAKKQPLHCECFNRCHSLDEKTKLLTPYFK